MATLSKLDLGRSQDGLRRQNGGIRASLRSTRFPSMEYLEGAIAAWRKALMLRTWRMLLASRWS